MRLAGTLFALAFLALPASAQPLLAGAGDVPGDAVLVEVAVEDLPAEVAESLPEGVSVFALQSPSLGYELPASLRASKKDPIIGLILSIVITGGAHFYAGETGKGLLLLGVGVGAPIAGALLSDGGNYGPYLVGLAVGLGVYVYSIFDGLKVVEEYNEANGFALAPVPMGAGAGLAMRVGL